MEEALMGSPEWANQLTKHNRPLYATETKYPQSWQAYRTHANDPVQVKLYMKPRSMRNQRGSH